MNEILRNLALLYGMEIKEGGHPGSGGLYYTDMDGKIQKIVDILDEKCEVQKETVSIASCKQYRNYNIGEDYLTGAA